jgi:hypothetical protein
MTPLPSTPDLALDYLAFNPTRYLFPIKAGAKFPPLIKDNLAAASNDPEQIKAWHKRWPGCNWGLALKKSRLMVVDVDTKPGKVGQDTYDTLGLLYEWPLTETVRTPNGGFHAYHEGEHIFALGANGFGPDVDSPNYVLIAGCTFKDGTSYQQTNSRASVAAPEWFYEVIKAAKKDKLANVGEIATDLDQPNNITWVRDYLANDAEPSIEGSGGEQQLFKVAATVRENGISEALACELINEIYNVEPKCVPIWLIEDLTAKVGNAYAYASQSMVGGKTADAEFGDEPLDFTDADVMGDRSKINTTEKRAKDKEARLAEGAAAKAVEDARGASEPVGRKWSLPEIRDRWVYVMPLKMFVCRDDTDSEGKKPRNMWDTEAFDKAFKYLCKRGKSKLSDALLSKRDGSIRRVDALVYEPGEPEFTGTGGFVFLNLYRKSYIVPAAPSSPKAIEGLEMWDKHLVYLFPDETERGHVLNWLAWFLQNIGKKPKHALMLQGPKQGTGKTFVTRVMRMILGNQNVKSVSQVQLTGQFNTYALHSKLLVVEEMHNVNKVAGSNKLHDMITEEPIDINIKNRSAFEVHNCFGLIVMTNDDAPLLISKFDRRYLIVRTDAEPKGTAYYVALYALLDDAETMGAIAC